MVGTDRWAGWSQPSRKVIGHRSCWMGRSVLFLSFSVFCSVAAFFSRDWLFLVHYIYFSSRSVLSNYMPRSTRPPSLSLDIVPIPPSLLASPYLYSPVFTHSPPCTLPRLPTEQDELWLQDTVPLPVSSSPSESSGSLRNSQPPKPPRQRYHRPVPQSPPIVINHRLHTHCRRHTFPEGQDFSNYRDSYSRSGSSSEPQTPSTSSPSPRQVSLPYRPSDAVDTRPPRLSEFSSHIRMHTDSVLSTHINSF